MQITKVPLNKLISPDWNPRQITEEELKKLEQKVKKLNLLWINFEE